MRFNLIIFSALAFLARQTAAEKRAAVASRRALELSLSQYEGGLTTYLQVVTAQTNSLLNERTLIQLEGLRRIAAVNLITALGGGWERPEEEGEEGTEGRAGETRGKEAASPEGR